MYLLSTYFVMKVSLRYCTMVVYLHELYSNNDSVPLFKFCCEDDVLAFILQKDALSCQPCTTTEPKSPLVFHPGRGTIID